MFFLNCRKHACAACANYSRTGRCSDGKKHTVMTAVLIKTLSPTNTKLFIIWFRRKWLYICTISLNLVRNWYPKQGEVIQNTWLSINCCVYSYFNVLMCVFFSSARSQPKPCAWRWRLMAHTTRLLVTYFRQSLEFSSDIWNPTRTLSLLATKYYLPFHWENVSFLRWNSLTT